MGKAEAVAGAVAGVVLWYIAYTACIVLLGNYLDKVLGIYVSVIAIDSWLSLGSLLMFMIAGIYIFDEDSRIETKSVLKWLIGGIVLWGLALIPMTVTASMIKINLDVAYNLSLLTGCLILLCALAIRSYRIKRAGSCT